MSFRVARICDTCEGEQFNQWKENARIRQEQQEQKKKEKQERDQAIKDWRKELEEFNNQHLCAMMGEIEERSIDIVKKVHCTRAQKTIHGKTITATITVQFS